MYCSYFVALLTIYFILTKGCVKFIVLKQLLRIFLHLRVVILKCSPIIMYFLFHSDMFHCAFKLRETHYFENGDFFNGLVTFTLKTYYLDVTGMTFSLYLSGISCKISHIHAKAYIQAQACKY